MPTEAGKGEHHVYRIHIAAADQDSLKANEHYLGVDAVAWFINKQSSWFSDRMASGTLDIKIQGGVEEYQASLGTFDLKGGSYYAPVFDRAVLPDRNYRGGPITLGASLSAIKKDTVIAGLLKSAASASLGVAAGMVQTATAAGPYQLLGSAGGELIKGVKTLLSDTGNKREPLFDYSGLEATLTPDKIVGPENYILFHRGATLPEDSLTVHATGELVLPYVGGNLLDDGVWLLMRLRRSAEYSGQRDWFGAARKLRANLQNLVTDYQNGTLTKDQALQRLKPSSTADQTLYDEYVRLRAVIQNDGVLTEKEAGLYAGQLNLATITARKAIEQEHPNLLTVKLLETKRALLEGANLADDDATIFAHERQAIATFRKAARAVTQTSELLFAEPSVTTPERGAVFAAAAASINPAIDVCSMVKAVEEGFRTAS